MGVGKYISKITVAAHATLPLGRKSALAPNCSALRTRPTTWARYLVVACRSLSFGGPPQAPGLDAIEPGYFTPDLQAVGKASSGVREA
jgi:hypothetical protein